MFRKINFYTVHVTRLKEGLVFCFLTYPSNLLDNSYPFQTNKLLTVMTMSYSIYMWERLNYSKLNTSAMFCGAGGGSVEPAFIWCINKNSFWVFTTSLLWLRHPPVTFLLLRTVPSTWWVVNVCWISEWMITQSGQEGLFLRCPGTWLLVVAVWRG